MLNTKINALILQVSEKKNFEVGFLCSYVPTCDPLVRASFVPHEHHMNKLGRGPQGDANQRTEGPESRTDGETLILWD